MPNNLTSVVNSEAREIEFSRSDDREGGHHNDMTVVEIFKVVLMLNSFYWAYFVICCSSVRPKSPVFV